MFSFVHGFPRVCTHIQSMEKRVVYGWAMHSALHWHRPQLRKERCRTSAEHNWCDATDVSDTVTWLLRCYVVLSENPGSTPIPSRHTQAEATGLVQEFNWKDAEICRHGLSENIHCRFPSVLPRDIVRWSWHKCRRKEWADIERVQHAQRVQLH